MAFSILFTDIDESTPSTLLGDPRINILCCILLKYAKVWTNWRMSHTTVIVQEKERVVVVIESLQWKWHQWLL
jgi:hypothetical protein